MTMVDEKVLARALEDVADSFAPAKDAATRILEAASSARGDETSRASSRAVAFFHSSRRARTVLLGAAAALVVGVASVPLVRAETPARTSAMKVFHSLPPTGTGLLVVGTGQSAPSPSLGAQGGVVTTGSPLTARALRLAPRIASSGSVSLRVTTGIESSFRALGNLASRDGGSVVSSRAYVGGAAGRFATGTIVLRVPQHEFATLVNQVPRLGRATSLVTTSQDVTSQYVDLGARLVAEEASRSQYLAIMTHATTIGGILAVQAQLDAIETQIEQLKGERNVLNAQTSDATLSVSLATATGALPPGHVSGIVRAWHDAIRGFVAGVEWLIRLSGPALFTLLVLGALLVLARLFWRAVERRRI